MLITHILFKLTKIDKASSFEVFEKAKQSSQSKMYVVCSCNFATHLFDSFHLQLYLAHPPVICIRYRNSSSNADWCLLWLIASLTEWIMPSPVDSWQHSYIASSMWLRQVGLAAALQTENAQNKSAYKHKCQWHPNWVRGKTVKLGVVSSCVKCKSHPSFSLFICEMKN